MRDKYLPRPVRASATDQLPLPFAELPRTPETIRTTRLWLDVRDRRGNAYELLIRQDPRTLCVLSYRLRVITVH